MKKPTPSPIWKRLRQVSAQFDKKIWLERTSEEVLTVHGVAKLLFATTQAVRLIPANQLPRYRRAGRYVLYLKADVLSYIRAGQVRRGNAEHMIREITDRNIKSKPDSGRRPKRKRR